MRKPRSTVAAATMAVGLATAAAWVLVPGRASAQPAAPGDRCVDPSCQGWAPHERSWWYTVTQGSRLLPLSWVRALEVPGSEEAFLSDANVRRFKYLPNPVSDDNPYGLPVGFAVDQEEGGASGLLCAVLGQFCERAELREPWVGMNCSACHTNEITYRGRTLRVEGAPTLADFQGLLEELLRALEATRDDDRKLARFAAEVAAGTQDRFGAAADAVSGGAARAGGSTAALKAELEREIAWQRRTQRQNATDLRYGFGRLDAQGHILNKVALIVGAEDQPPRPSDAPASYPHLWNVPQQKKLQWNGLADNDENKITIGGRRTDIGALGRNTGEVIGVFAKVQVSEQPTLRGYASSLRVGNMIDIERQLERLHPPRWPEGIFPAIDRGLADEGRRIFDRVGCDTCHQTLAQGDLETRPDGKKAMLPLPKAGTDVWLACNTYLHESNAGRLAGRRVSPDPRDAAEIMPVDTTRKMLVHTISQTILGRADELVAKTIADAVTPRAAREAAMAASTVVEYLPEVRGKEDKKRQAKLCLETPDPILAYKAGPLNGVWATAPYLHNGSVPTLHDLLLPSTVRNSTRDPAPPAPGAATRPEVFHVGGREFDPVKVGLGTAPGEGTFEFRVRDAATGEPILGNYNAGHEGPEYGTQDLTDAQRAALVEYLKTL